MVALHWANQDIATQVTWKVVEDIVSIVGGFDKVGEYFGLSDEVSVRTSAEVPAVFFEFNGGSFAREMWHNDDGYDVTFTTITEPHDLTAGHAEFSMMDQEDNDTAYVEEEMYVVVREFHGVTIHTVDAHAVLTMFRTWLDTDKMIKG